MVNGLRQQKTTSGSTHVNQKQESETTVSTKIDICGLEKYCSICISRLLCGLISCQLEPGWPFPLDRSHRYIPAHRTILCKLYGLLSGTITGVITRLLVN